LGRGKIFKPWGSLNESRRGWALGSILGLGITAFYFIAAIKGLNPYGAHYTFSLVSSPAIPGLFCAEQISQFVHQRLFALDRQSTQIFYIGLCSLINYFFWGGYFSLLFKVTVEKKSINYKILFFSFLNLFTAVIGISYSINRGVSLQNLSPSLFILFCSLALAMISFVIIFEGLISHKVSSV
jgi:hypothetical protein